MTRFSYLLPKRISPEESAMRDEILARIIRDSYKMPDVPHWVEDNLECGCALLHGMWRAFWPIVAMTAMFVAMYDVSAFLNQYPYMPIKACVSMIFVAASIALFLSPFMAPKRVL